MDNIKQKIQKLNEKALKYKNESCRIVEACRLIGKSWSGSSLVGHAKYFYNDFQEPKTTERFNIEWGLINGVPNGWEEKSDEEIRQKIESDSNSLLDKIKDVVIELENDFLGIQREAVLFFSENNITDLEIKKIEDYSIKSATDIFNNIFPTQFMTRDRASATGHYIAPHIYYEAVAKFIVDFPQELKGFIFEVEKINKKIIKPNKQNINEYTEKNYYIDNKLILSLVELKSNKYDLTKLIKMCKELNDNYSLNNYVSCGMLIRAILDHVPPIFNKKSFKEVSNNYGTKSFRDIVSPLENTARKISDSYLHNFIRKKELLPGKTQIDFQPNMDVLLTEIIRILKE
jgi:hypothetical protein